MCPEPDELIETVAGATAACLSEVLHELVAAPADEAYCRVAAHVEAALRVLDEERTRRRGRARRSDPSRN